MDNIIQLILFALISGAIFTIVERNKSKSSFKPAYILADVEGEKNGTTPISLF